MKIAMINTSHYGSTGRIMLSVAAVAREAGHEVRTYSKLWRSNPEIEGHTYIGSKAENILHRAVAPVLSTDGCFSSGATERLIESLSEFDPDVVHLHNLHGWYLNYEKLFGYIKSSGAKVIWTLHDCWAFTGQCPHFLVSGCDRWMTGCGKCKDHKHYPEMLFDGTAKMWKRKKETFCGVEGMTLVTPSAWLSELTRRSFLSEYPVRVINNGIDLSVFSPCEENEKIKKKLGCEGKRIVLGVSFVWEYRKGLDVFIELCRRLPDDFRVVLVGVDEKLMSALPKEIVAIGRTESQRELSEIYSAADVFVNPTREDNFPTVNIEALASGTPVITFDVGGAAEIIDETCGVKIPVDRVDDMEREIVRVCENRPYSVSACTERSKRYDAKERFMEYRRLYEE